MTLAVQYKTSPSRRARSLSYYRKNAETINTRRRETRGAAPEVARANERARRAMNPTKARARDVAYAKRHPDRVRMKRVKRQLRSYGLTIATFNALLGSQSGLCAICQEPFPSKKQLLHIDHCHKTGRLRGVLCQHCNVLLGMAKENTRTLAGAIAYLEGAVS